MTEYGPIQSPWYLTILVLTLVFYIVVGVKPGLSLGIYISMASAAKAIKIGSVTLIWVFLIAAIISTLRYFNKHRTSLNYGNLRSKWIIGVMVYWALYTYILIAIVRPEYEIMYVRNLTAYIIITTIILLILARDNKQIQSFAYGYILFTLLNSYIILKMGGFEFNMSLLSELNSSGNNVQQVIHNYHRIGTGFGISCILLFHIYLNSKKFISKIVVVSLLIYTTGILTLINSRQMILATIISITIFIYIHITKKGLGKKIYYLLNWLIFMGFISIVLIAWQEVVFRGIGFDLSLSSSLAVRSDHWKDAFNIILNSPIMGSAFQTRTAHNLFLGTYEAQGIMGFILISIYILFTFNIIKRLVSSKIYTKNQWTTCFIVIYFYGLIHGQISGDFISIPHLYWPIGLVWIQWNLSMNSQKI